nr:hypothetical protein [Candidatus Palauibacter scopulicola]
MVVDDLDVVRVSGAPEETDPPLLVDANAVLIGPIALQFLQPIARRHPEIRKINGRVEHPELSERASLNVRRQSRNGTALEEALGITVAESLDHLE